MGTSFETFQESEDQEEMDYPIAGLDESHELWKNALGRTNAFLFQERQALLLAISSAAEAQSPSEVDMSDIDLFFQIEGRGPKLLEFEFEPSTTEAIPYIKTRSKKANLCLYAYHANSLFNETICRQVVGASRLNQTMGFLEQMIPELMTTP
jgi:hypothetical protein